jgi:hypothetical protein
MLRDQLNILGVRAGPSFSERCVRHGDRGAANARRAADECRENMRDGALIHEENVLGPLYLRLPATVLAQVRGSHPGCAGGAAPAAAARLQGCNGGAISLREAFAGMSYARGTVLLAVKRYLCT